VIPQTEKVGKTSKIKFFENIEFLKKKISRIAQKPFWNNKITRDHVFFDIFRPKYAFF